jgi:hypothetical protein
MVKVALVRVALVKAKFRRVLSPIRQRPARDGVRRKAVTAEITSSLHRLI